MSEPREPSEAAEEARRRLHEEIERVRAGVEQMLAEQEGGGDPGERRVERIEERLLRLEGRVDQIERERRYAEWRLYSNVEALLDRLLDELRRTNETLARSNEALARSAPTQ